MNVEIVQPAQGFEVEVDTDINTEAPVEMLEEDQEIKAQTVVVEVAQPIEVTEVRVLD